MNPSVFVNILWFTTLFVVGFLILQQLADAAQVRQSFRHVVGGGRATFTTVSQWVCHSYRKEGTTPRGDNHNQIGSTYSPFFCSKISERKPLHPWPHIIRAQGVKFKPRQHLAHWIQPFMTVMTVGVLVISMLSYLGQANIIRYIRFLIGTIILLQKGHTSKYSILFRVFFQTPLCTHEIAPT